MTDSFTRKPEDNTSEKLKARLAKYADRVKDKRKIEEVADLPTWVMTALLHMELQADTYAEAAKKVSRAPKTLNDYATSPAAKRWLSEIRDMMSDPVQAAQAFLRGSAMGITLDRITFLEAAKAAGDYAAADKIAADLQDRAGVTKKQPKNDSPMAIHVTFAGSSFEPPTIRATVVEDTPQLAAGSDYEVIEEGNG